MTPGKRKPVREREVIDEDSPSGEQMVDTDGDGIPDTRRNYVTRSPVMDRIVTWVLLIAGSGGAIMIPRSPDPAPQIERLAAEMRLWREDVTTKLAEINKELAVVKFQLGKPDTADERMRELEKRLLEVERRLPR